MEHRRLLSGGVLAVCAVFAALALFAAPVLGGKGGFSVRSFSPQGEIENAAEIVARFTEAAVAEDAVGKKLAPSESPFSFSPEIAGTGVWRDVSTFVFTPSGGRLAACDAVHRNGAGFAGLRRRRGAFRRAQLYVQHAGPRLRRGENRLISTSRADVRVRA